MEAPEKIYLEAVYPDNGVLPNGLNYTPSPTDIEYTRTDAFIEKACEWLSKNSPNYINYFISHDFGKFVEDFREAMKGK